MASSLGQKHVYPFQLPVNTCKIELLRIVSLQEMLETRLKISFYWLLPWETCSDFIKMIQALALAVWLNVSMKAYMNRNSKYLYCVITLKDCPLNFSFSYSQLPPWTSRYSFCLSTSYCTSSLYESSANNCSNTCLRTAYYKHKATKADVRHSERTRTKDTQWGIMKWWMSFNWMSSALANILSNSHIPSTNFEWNTRTDLRLLSCIGPAILIS